MARRVAEHQFQAGEVAINYAASASAGPQMVLLHGLAARWQTFMPLVLPLSQEWQLFLLDLRGHGLSGRTPERYQLADFVGDVVAFIERQAAPPVVLYGHSLGGWIALEIAAQRPELVRAVIVGDSALYVEHLDADAAISYLSDLPIAMRSLAKSLTQLDPAVMRAFHAGELTLDDPPERLLPQIACPVLLLQADTTRGGLMTDGDVTSGLALLRHGSHVRFPGLGHGLHVENTEPILEAVTAFLATLPARQASPRAE
jgi:pimeloyl-ACP methyl ester carboxylesterase